MDEPQKINLHLNQNIIWPHNVLTLTRNLATHSFPEHLKAQDKQELTNIIIETFNKCASLGDFTIYYIDRLSHQECEGVYEHFLLDVSSHHDKYQAIALSSDLSLIVLINFENHLSIISTVASNSPQNQLDHLLSINRALEEHLQFAHSKTFGYLTKNIAHCGNSLTFRSYLHLPLLIYQNDSLLFKDYEEIKIKKAESLGESEGHVISIENNKHLGMDEEAILSTVAASRTILLEKEREALLDIQKTKPLALQDRISRDHSLGKGAKTMSTHEALSIISHISLGDKLGWINDLQDFCFKDLFFSIRRGHLTTTDDNEESLSVKRALVVNKALQGSQFSG